MKSIAFVLGILTALLLPLSLLPDVTPSLSVPHALAAQKPSSPLMATEREVRGFFDQYIERYNHRDLEGFLSLFSSKAKQNQQDGLPEIRKLYSDFFNEVISLQNSVEEMKIEIYQNATEVKARYAVTQVLKKEGEKRVMRGSARWILIKEDGVLKILSIDYKHDKTP
ncbi:MAG TPA: nuclear transport factor 2 family protein [Thermodesulfobacteriota bacterium]|nr:nuclear transport factor 2 family protein [Thermodesulfobacteriota bacterium]